MADEQVPQIPQVPQVPQAQAQPGQAEDAEPAVLPQPADQQDELNLETLLRRVRHLENGQLTTVDSLIAKITQYGGRRVQDFDKYEALHLAEQLASVAKSTGHDKATSFDIIAAALRERMSCPAQQYKSYFLALLADKEFTRIIDTISKVDKSFSRPGSTQAARGRGRATFRSHPYQRVVCYRCGTPGHKSPQCWLRSSTSAAGQPQPLFPQQQPRNPRS